MALREEEVQKLPPLVEGELSVVAVGAVGAGAERGRG